MRIVRSFAIAAAAAMVVAGCSPTSSGDGAGEAPEVAATVDGVEIPSERIEEIVDLQAAALEDTEESELPERRLDAARQALSAEIQLQAVEAAVEERFGLDIPDDEVEAALEEQIEAQGGQEAFDELAAEEGLSSEAARGFARDNAYVTVLVEYVQEQLAEEGGITEEELRAQYDADPTQFQSADVSHILVETEEEAQEALSRLEEGEDFAELATELSTDPGSGQNGGSLGEAPRGSYVPEFSEAVYSEDTEIGEVVGPVETQFGFHLIRVDGRTTPEFEDVRDQLEAQLVGAQFNEFLQAVFEDVTVEVDPYYGTWDPQQRMVVPLAEEGTEDGATEDGATEDGATEDGAAEDGATDGATDDGATEDGAAEDGATDGTTDDGAAEDGTTDDGAAEDGAAEGATEDGTTEGGAADDGATEDSGAGGDEG